MSGALAERVFAIKTKRIGFVDVEVCERIPFTVDDAASYPLFTPDLVELMRGLIPAAQQRAVATSIVLTARKPD